MPPRIFGLEPTLILNIGPVSVGTLLGSGTTGQRRRVEHGRTATAAAQTARRAGADGRRHGARFGVGDTLRHGEDATIDDDHDNER